MIRRRASFLCGFLALLFACGLGIETPAQTTRPADDTQIVQSLLNEVRLLRKVLQRTGLSASRSQIILERIRAQNDQVLRLTRLLEETRREIENVEGTIPRMTEQSKLLEDILLQETSPAKRIQLEFEQKEIRRQAENYKVRLERVKEREAQLSAQLRGEQTRLTELDGRLDALEREIEYEIERQRSEDASQDGRKKP